MEVIHHSWSPIYSMSQEAQALGGDAFACRGVEGSVMIARGVRTSWHRFVLPPQEVERCGVANDGVGQSASEPARDE